MKKTITLLKKMLVLNDGQIRINILRCLLILIILMWAGGVKGQNADFIIKPDSVAQGSNVTFQNVSTGFDSSVYYAWTFFDAGIIYSHPIHFENIMDTTNNVMDTIIMNYNIAKTYRVLMEVYDSNSILVDSISKLFFIIDNAEFSDCNVGTFNSCDYLCNGSFENLGSGLTLNSPSTLYKANRWATPKIPTGYLNASGHPDLYSRNATSSLVQVPINFTGTQQPSPASGNNYVGIVCYDADSIEYREYAQTQLLVPLIPYAKYVIGMRISFAENSAYSIDTIGICLTDNKPGQYFDGTLCVSNLFYWVGTPTATFTMNPQIKAKVQSDTQNWIEISDTIIGNNELYLTIGNFNNAQQSNPTYFSDNTIAGQSLAYYYIDSVFITPVHNSISQEFIACIGDTVQLISSVPYNDSIIYEWSNAIGEGNSYTNIVFTGDTTIYCSVTYFGAYTYCPIVDTFHIVEPTPPVVTINNPIVPCGGCATITVSGLDNGTYIWSTGDTTASIYVCALSTTSEYTVTVYGNYHCNPTILSAMAIVPPAPTAPQFENYIGNICDSTTFTFPYSILNPDSSLTYTWQLITDSTGIFLNNDTIGDNVVITWNPANIPTTPGYAIIQVSATDSNNCFSTSEIHVFDCCSPYENDTSITTLLNTDAVTALTNNFYQNRTFMINGNFLINKDMVFEHCKFEMGQEAEIIVDSAIHLIIDKGTRLYQKCGFMWKGIYLDDSTSVLTFTGSYIDDAYVGISANNNAKVHIYGDEFTNNNIGIKIKDCLNATNGIDDLYGNLFKSFVYNSAYSFYPPMQSAYRKPYAGIVIENSNNVIVGKANAMENTFRNLYNGIRSTNSDIAVVNNIFDTISKCFSNHCMASFYEPLGVGVYSVKTIHDGFAAQGIWVGDSGTNGNYFNNCDYGVYLNNNNNFTVSKNSFDNNQTAIFGSENTLLSGSKMIHNNMIDHAKYFGIDLRMLKNCAIQYNTIKHISVPSGNSSTASKFGIRAQGCLNTTIYNNDIYNETSGYDFKLGLEGISAQGGAYMVSCNTITKMGKAMAFYGNTMVSTVKLNGMHDCKYGIYLNHGMIGQQGTAGKPSDNMWNDSIYAHTFTENNATVDNLPIYVRDTSNSFWNESFYPTNMLNDNNWSNSFTIIGTTGVNGTYCLELPIVMSMVHFKLNEENGSLIANRKITYNEFERENVWMSDYYLYNYLKDIQADSLQSWMISFLTKYDVNDKAIDTITNFMNDRHFKDALKLIGKNKSQSQPAVNLLEIYKAICEAALSENNVSDDILFYDFQLVKLQKIAWMCPYEAGDAVYLARAILSRIDDIDYINECEIENEKRMIEKPIVETKIEQIVKVYPNPTKDEFYVEYIGNTDERKIIVELYSIYGQLEKKIESYNTKITISTRDLASGIYYYRISVGNDMIRKDKIIILK